MVGWGWGARLPAVILAVSGTVASTSCGTSEASIQNGWERQRVKQRGYYGDKQWRMYHRVLAWTQQWQCVNMERFNQRDCEWGVRSRADWWRIGVVLCVCENWGMECLWMEWVGAHIRTDLACTKENAGFLRGGAEQRMGWGHTLRAQDNVLKQAWLQLEIHNKCKKMQLTWH